MSRRGEVLIAILNNPLDLELARDQHWYRIPQHSVDKWLRDAWPPTWLAFYQTKVFGDEAFSVNYFAKVLDTRQVFRYQLFPDEPRDKKGRQRYQQLILSPLQPLQPPIFSRRWRRIVFIPTTWQKFTAAREIDGLYHESPLEERLWTQFKRLGITAERQEYVQLKERAYALDFAIYCSSGKIDVETDGDRWHADPERIPLDNLRDNDLETVGWRVLRFNTHHIREQLSGYCLPTITENINRLGGENGERLVPRKVDLETSEKWRQSTLFEARDGEPE